MSAITFAAINFTGTPDQEDQMAARLAVQRHNIANPGANLGFSPAATLKASYLTVLLTAVNSIHASNVANSKTISGTLDLQIFTEDQVKTILSNLGFRVVVGGESVAQIVADSASPGP